MTDFRQLRLLAEVSSFYTQSTHLSRSVSLIRSYITALKKIYKVCALEEDGRHCPRTYKYLKRLCSVTRRQFQLKTSSQECN